MTRRKSFAGACLLASALALPAFAGPFGASADRSSAQPLRGLDIAAIATDRRELGAEAQRAYERLPEECRDHDAIRRVEACEDELRCGWLAARYELAGTLASGQRALSHAAAEWMNDIADRLVAGTGCGRGSSGRERWEADAQQAAIDDGLAQLALLLELGEVGGGPVLDPAGERTLAELLDVGRARGLSGVSTELLARHRKLLALARARRAWLAEQPGIARFRAAMVRLWAQHGGVPQGCGEGLLRPENLGDRWRGHLVSKEIPAAMNCLAERYPRMVSRAGRRLASRRAPELARQLAELARRDTGGRRFGSDPEVLARLGELAEGLASEAPARPAPPRRAAAAKSAPAPKKAAPPEEKKPAPAKSGRRASAKPALEPERVAPGQADPDLLHLARRVGHVVGDAGHLERSARNARSFTEKDQVLDRLVVELHREVCAPLTTADTGDLGAIEAVFDSRGNRPLIGACQGLEGKAGLENLLIATPELVDLRWAVTLRTAGRLAALGRPERAAPMLEEVPEAYRGVTWTLLRAWIARLEGEPVVASRTLAHLDEATVARLQATGDEAVARLFAHAWNDPKP